MKEDIRKFLTAAERLAIETRVKSAESGASGEIVVMAVPASNHYHAANLAGSGTCALILAIVVMLLLRSENMWLFLPIFAFLFVGAYELFKRILWLNRPFVDRREMAEAVEEASVRAFFHSKVHETRHRAGILIYISLFERSVRVLADTGIDSKAGPQAWQEIVALVTKGIERGAQGEAIIEAVDRCAELLLRHFPGREKGVNELGDAVILGSPED
jgi:putative membrane protein